jgi:hypothetical protein
MKHHLHKHLNLAEDDIVAVHSDAPATVFFADDENYKAYLEDFDYDYFGTEVKKFPFYMAPPEPGIWHLVVEQPDPEQSITVRIEIISET